MRSSLLKTKVVAVAAGTVLGVGGLAAAATGNLPDPAQDAVAEAASRAGLALPVGSEDEGHQRRSAAARPEHGADANADEHRPDDDDAAIDAAITDAHSNFGLCTAFLAAPDDHAGDNPDANAHDRNAKATAFEELIADHGGTVAATEAFCEGVVSAKHAERGHDGGTDGDNLDENVDDSDTTGGTSSRSGEHRQDGEHRPDGDDRVPDGGDTDPGEDDAADDPPGATAPGRDHPHRTGGDHDD